MSKNFEQTLMMGWKVSTMWSTARFRECHTRKSARLSTGFISSAPFMALAMITALGKALRPGALVIYEYTLRQAGDTLSLATMT